MTKIDVSDSNNILKNILIILIVAGLAYLIYYLYNQNTHQKMIHQVQEEQQHQVQPVQRMQPPREEGSIGNVSSRMQGSPNGLSNPIMDKRTYLAKGPIVGDNNMEHFSNSPDSAVERNLTSFPKDTLTADELLPQDNSSLWAQVNPSGEGSLKDRNFLQSGYHIGINTVGQTLRNANLQLRSEPPCPQIRVSPWAQSTIEPDVSRKPFEIGGCA